MNPKKTISLTIFPFLLSSLIYSSNLVEAAKKERERRQKLNGKNGIVVTNADLRKVRKEAALIVVRSKTIPQQKETPRPPERRISTKVATSEIPKDIDREEPIDVREFFATEVLPSSRFVDNSQFSIDKPDEQYADLNYFGCLDIEIDAKNGEGNDIAIYARRPTYGILPETYNILVYAEHEGKWHIIGVCTGITSPEYFDFGEIKSTSKIKLFFRDYLAGWNLKPLRRHRFDYSIKIDAIEALHR